MLQEMIACPSWEEILSEEFVNSYSNRQPDWYFGTLSYVVYKRSYARLKENGTTEEWHETIARAIRGAQKIGAKYTREEAERLFDHIFNLRCCFSGRGLWQLGTATVDKFGMDSLLNCWGTKTSEISDFIFIIIESMLGGGVGCSLAKEFTHELPRVKNNVHVYQKNTKDADFIVPDSKEGWSELGRKILEAFLITGKGFSYSPICIRTSGEPIKTFGGIAPGPQPLMEYAKDLVELLQSRSGKKLRTQDVADMITLGGQMVKSGGVRRTALIFGGDVDDLAYLSLKRWDLGTIPNHRSNSNNSLLCPKFDYLPDKFWAGYNGNGEAYGLLNLPLARKYGRLGETMWGDFSLINNDIIIFNPCLTEDTSILTTEGIKTIKDLVGKPFTVLVNNKEYASTNKGFFYQGKKQVYQLTLDRGIQIKCTDNHKFLTNNGFKELQDLQINDVLILNQNSSQWNGIGSFEEGWLLGNLVGDGYISENGSDATLSYWGTTKLEMKAYAVQALNNSVRCRKDTGSGGIIEKADRCNIGSKGLLDLASQYDLDYHKNLNSKIENTSWDFYRGLLCGWFDADGSVQGNQQNHGVSVRLTSIKLNNLQIAQRMLLRLGIISTIYQNRLEAGYRKLPDGYGSLKEYWCEATHELVITKDQLVRFAKIINFIDSEKRTKLDKIVANYKRSPNKSHFTAKVSNIQKLEIESVYDCTINELHAFDANGLISHNCAEATLEDKECCNLATLNINKITSVEEMMDCAKLLYKTQKAIAAGPYIFPETNKVVHKNMRLGLSVTGICQKLNVFEDWCDQTYRELRRFDKEWSAQNGWPQSIRLTVIQPNGTLGSLVLGSTPGAHTGYARFTIRRVRFDAKDPLVARLKKAGYSMEPEIKFDGKYNHDIMVVDFPTRFSDDTLVAEQSSAIDQLERVKKLQTCWADQAVSATVYYKPEELDGIKEWLKQNYDNSIKSISFLLHQDHNFKQAPYEPISEEMYNKLIQKLKPLDHGNDSGGEIDSQECQSGMCPLR